MSDLMPLGSLVRGSLALDTQQSPKQRFLYALRALLPARYGRNVLPRNTQATSDLRVQAPIAFDAAKLRLQRDIRDGSVVNLHKRGCISAVVPSQGKNTSEVVAGGKGRVAQEIRALRESLKLSQAELARRCDVTQQAVSQWESGTDTPKPNALWRLAEIAATSEGSRRFFEREIARASGIADADEQRAGALRNFLSGKAGRRTSSVSRASGSAGIAIPLLKDSIAAGTPRAMDEKNIERELLIPQEWLPAANRSGKGLVAVRVAGDSMSPIIEPGYVVLIDTQAKDPRKLLNKMVAAREDEGRYGEVAAQGRPLLSARATEHELAKSGPRSRRRGSGQVGHRRRSG
jgi:transcriptional regulator with XRE-family HTH domain